MKTAVRAGPGGPRRRASTVALALATLAFVLGAALTFTGTAWLGTSIEEQARSNFERRVERLQLEVQRRLENSLSALRGVAGMYAASTDVNDEEFQTFVDNLDLAGSYPGLIGLAFADFADIADVANPGLHKPPGATPTAQLRIVSASSRELVQASLVAALAADPDLAARIQLPAMVGDSVLGHFHRSPDTADTRLLVLLPVHRRALAARTGAGRPQDPPGMVLGVIAATGLLDTVAAGSAGELDFQLRDDSDGTPVLFDTRTRPAAAAVQGADRKPHLMTQRWFSIGGRALSIRATSAPAFDDAIDRASPLWLAAGGTLLSLMVALCIWLLALSRNQALALAQAMRADLARLAKVAENTSNSVIITDTDVRIVWVNRGFERTWGYSATEALGRAPEELLHFEGTDPGQQAAIRQALADVRDFTGELLNRAKDGSEHWVQLEFQPLRDDQGRHIGFIAMQTDITAMKAVSAALQRERQRLDAILEGSHVGTIEWNMRTGQVVPSQRAAEMLGCQLGDPAPSDARFWRERMHADDVALTRAAMQRYLQGEASHYECELRYRHRQGHWVWVLARLKIVGRTADGAPEWIAGTHMDISPRKAEEERLRLREEQLRKITASVPGVVYQYELTPQGQSRFGFLSGGLSELFGLDPQAVEADAALFFKAVPAAEHAALRASILESATALQRWHGEFQIGPGAVPKWIAADALPHRLDDGSTVWYGLFTDVTERKRIQAQLALAMASAEQAVRAKSAFLATMSHEIRTPMNGVIGMAEVLANTPLDEQQADAVQTIRESGESLLHIIDDILDFSKIEAGRLTLEQTLFSLPALIEGACDTLSAVASRAQVSLDLFVDPALPEQVLSDPTRLRQVLYNLVGNAIKFSSRVEGRRGRVAVRAEVVAGPTPRFSLSVADNGIGMSAEVVDKLFVPFTQAEASTTRRFGGTGLGLAICHRLVALMDGQIDVCSQAGAGTRFSVNLPLWATPEQPPRPLPSLQGVSCLVVAADTGRAADLVAYLADSGAQVAVVGHVADAAGHARQRRDAAPGGDRSPLIVLHDDPALAAQPQAVLAQGFESAADLRHLVLGRGARAHARIVAPNLATLDLMRRAPLLRAVRMLAGLESPELSASALIASGVLGLPAARMALPGGTRTQILVAEDDPINQKVILRQLGLLGHSADMVSTGEEALRRWREGQHGLLLTDLHMPVMDGYTLAQRIRHEERGQRRMPILALTANALRGEAERALAAGMDEYLTKPVQLKTLGAALARWLPDPPLAPPSRSATTGGGSTSAGLAQFAVLDLEVLKSIVGDEPGTVDEFLTDYRDSLQLLGAELNASFKTGDLNLVASIAHKLKSASRSVGALQLGELCAVIEREGQHGRQATLAPCQAAFEAAVCQVRQAIASALHREPA